MGNNGFDKARVEEIRERNQEQREALNLAREEAEIAERAKIETAERERLAREKWEAEDAEVIGAVNRAKRARDERTVYGSTTDDMEVFVRVVAGQKKGVKVTVHPTKKKKRRNYTGPIVCWGTGMVTGAGLMVIVGAILGVL